MRLLYAANIVMVTQVLNGPFPNLQIPVKMPHLDSLAACQKIAAQIEAKRNELSEKAGKPERYKMVCIQT